jgi:hypothetical protein
MGKQSKGQHTPPAACGTGPHAAQVGMTQPPGCRRHNWHCRGVAATNNRVQLSHNWSNLGPEVHSQSVNTPCSATWCLHYTVHRWCGPAALQQCLRSPWHPSCCTTARCHQHQHMRAMCRLCQPTPTPTHQPTTHLDVYPHTAATPLQRLLPGSRGPKRAAMLPWAAGRSQSLCPKTAAHMVLQLQETDVLQKAAHIEVWVVAGQQCRLLQPGAPSAAMPVCRNLLHHHIRVRRKCRTVSPPAATAGCLPAAAHVRAHQQQAAQASPIHCTNPLLLGRRA